MIDLKFLRENPDLVKENIKKKFQDHKLPLVDEVIEYDKKAREAQQEADDLRAKKNQVSKQIGALMAQGKKEEAEAVKAEVSQISKRLTELEPLEKEYQKQIVKNAQALCKGLQSRGIKIVSDGTDNHLMLVDLTPFGLTGKSIEKLLDAAHITANKNTIPNDPQKPFVTSGIRLGTPAATSRGLKEDDFDKVAEAIAMIIKEGESAVEPAKAIIKTLTDKYPLAF